MKSVSPLVLLSGASVALAGPLKQRALNVVYDVVVETNYVYYTVTATQQEEAMTSSSSSIEQNIVTVTVGAATSSSTSVAEPDVQAAGATSPTQTSSTAAATSTGDSFADVATYHHNSHRANSSAVDMVYDDTYADYAATLAARCKFEHDVSIGGGDSYGQNIAMYASTGLSSMTKETALAQAISNMWYNSEIDLFPSSDYGKATPDMSNFEGWGHYTQILWNGSTTLGCAVQLCEAGTMESDMDAYFTVCNYYPAGNVDGEYGDNVYKPEGGISVSVTINA